MKETKIQLSLPIILSWLSYIFLTIFICYGNDYLKISDYYNNINKTFGKRKYHVHSLLYVNITYPTIDNSISTGADLKWSVSGILINQKLDLKETTSMIVNVYLNNNLLQFPDGNNISFSPTEYVSISQSLYMLI